MNIVVAQFYTSNVQYAEYATKINQLYCEQHGYTYYAETDTQKILSELNGRSPTWYKPKLITDVLHKFSPDYVLFLDIDAAFVDFNDKIENYISEDHDLLFTDDYSIHSNMNAGVFLVKNTDWSKNAMNTWWDICETLTGKEVPNLIHPDESRCSAGYFRTQLWHDQSCLTYLYQNDSDFREHVKIITHRRLNWREAFDSNFIYHAFAYGHVPYRNLQHVYSKITDTPLYIAEQEDSLLDIANQFFTDKETDHKYFTRAYVHLFSGLKQSAENIAEIGVLDGHSLAIWKNYFSNANVIGIDKNPTCGIAVSGTDRVSILIADAGNSEDLSRLHSELPMLDILIDDGGHRMDQQQLALAYLFPKIKDGGLFIIEDLQTSTEAKMPEKEIFNWGDPSKTTTLDMLRLYQQTGKIVSDYLTPDQCIVLENMIDSIVIYDEYGEYNSILCVIKRKS